MSTGNSISGKKEKEKSFKNEEEIKHYQIKENFKNLLLTDQILKIN